MNLRKAAQQALEALEEYQQKGAPFMSCNAAVATLRAALSDEAMQRMEPTSQESRQVEPVAWRFYDGKIWCYVNHISDLSASTKFEPLYTAPPKRKPLTDEEIDYWIGSNSTKKALCRAIERAHDIGGGE